MMDNVHIPNEGSEISLWNINMPDGSMRKVQGSVGEIWVASVVHGKYMDVIPSGDASGSSSTFYCDYFMFNGGRSRIVCRGCNHASAAGGVSFLDAICDSSSAWAHVGSRLAFRGRIVKANSVAVFKAIIEVA